jgi:hypothetical protein
MSSKSITFPKMFVLALLAAVFTLSFIITPYWTHVSARAEMIFILAATLGIGIIWVVLSADELQIRVESGKWGYFFFLLAGMIVLNLRPLTASLPWRGDEDFHISNTLQLASGISAKWVIAELGGFVLVAYLAWKKSKWTIRAGLLLMAIVITITITKNPLAEISSFNLLRYPYFSYWFFAAIPKLVMLFKISPFQEVLFRIAPFMSAVALIWVFQRKLSTEETPLNLLWGITMATIPLLYYYSSILYFELPAALLMLLVCINVKDLLKTDYDHIRRNPAWYALILIGFIKETTIPFLLCFLGWRLITNVWQGRTSLKEIKFFTYILSDEGRIALAVLLPAIFYLFLRNALSHQQRAFSLTISNLTNLIVYRTIGQSFLEQLGLPVILLFCGGCILLIMKKEYVRAGFFLSLILLYPLFYAVDALKYTGYSRFNLFVLPPVLAASTVLIEQWIKDRKTLAIVVACLILSINLWKSPVFIDGTKKPFWGNYLADTSEHYYPYPEALGWLKNNYANAPVLFTGMYYPYFFDFYFNQLGWAPDHKILLTNIEDNDSVSLSRALIEAEAANFDIVVFQVLGKEPPQGVDTGRYREEKTLRNDAHLLIIYHRTP